VGENPGVATVARILACGVALIGVAFVPRSADSMLLIAAVAVGRAVFRRAAGVGWF
jgi:hypothetical protein